MSLPAGCQTNECTGIAADSASYSLQDALYFNGTALTVPVTCPEGAICTPGSFPPTVTYPPGTFVFPNVPQTPGQPIVLSMKGCQSTVTTVLPAGATAAQVQAAADAIILEVAEQQAQCDSFPEFPFGTFITMSDLEAYACVGASFEGEVEAVITPSSYPATFSIIGGALPDGVIMSQNETTALFTGTPTTAGASTFTLRATAANGVNATRAYTITVVGITTASPLPDAITGEPYSETLAISGITGTLIWGVASGSMPDSLELNTSTGEISGTPTTSEVGSYSFSIFVQNGERQCAKDFEITVDTCLITTASPLPDGDIRLPYSTTLAATDITGTLTWSIIAGSLPPGLALNTATGEISGMPTTVGPYSFTAQVTSGDNTCAKDFSLDVFDPAGVFWDMVWDAPVIGLTGDAGGSASGANNSCSGASNVGPWVGGPANNASVSLFGSMTLSPTSAISGFASAVTTGSHSSSGNYGTFVLQVGGITVFRRSNFAAPIGDGTFTIPIGVGILVAATLTTECGSGNGAPPQPDAKNESVTALLTQV